MSEGGTGLASWVASWALNPHCNACSYVCGCRCRVPVCKLQARAESAGVLAPTDVVAVVGVLAPSVRSLGGREGARGFHAQHSHARFYGELGWDSMQSAFPAASQQGADQPEGRTA